MGINFETLSFSVAIASIVLAVVSLVLSILFYRWSDKSNTKTFEMSQGIENNTKKIEGLFDRFYSDTFGLMKSNYEAMQSVFINGGVSSGDSTFTEEEQIESIILSVLVKSRFSTRENICYFIDKVHPGKKLSHHQINSNIDNLEKKGSVLIENSLISIASLSHSTSDEGAK